MKVNTSKRHDKTSLFHIWRCGELEMRSYDNHQVFEGVLLKKPRKNNLPLAVGVY